PAAAGGVEEDCAIKHGKVPAIITAQASAAIPVIKGVRSSLRGKYARQTTIFARSENLTPSGTVQALIMDDAVIEVSGLRKEYRSTLRRRIMALDGIDISVRPGELFGLLGPNGAGKTTTVKVLLGLTAATSGSARIGGLPVSNPESRRSVGYLPE